MREKIKSIAALSITALICSGIIYGIYILTDYGVGS